MVQRPINAKEAFTEPRGSCGDWGECKSVRVPEQPQEPSPPFLLGYGMGEGAGASEDISGKIRAGWLVRLKGRVAYMSAEQGHWPLSFTTCLTGCTMHLLG